jgi:small nuclear ribonucleoprotein (snRNP)-like protein
MADNTGRRKENIVDLNKYLEKRIRVKFNGGRECSGALKGKQEKSISFFRNLFFLLI